MTDAAAPQPEETEPAAAAPVSEEQAKLDRLYHQLPSIIALITEDNLNQGNVALKRLLAHFRKINELEQKLLPEGGNYTPLSLPRLYELAQGGGANANTEALQQANDAYAEENKILAEAIESLTFQIDALKKKAADELLNTGKVDKVPLAALKTAIGDVAKTMAQIERELALLGQNGAAPNAQAKPLDERLAAELSKFEDITADLLKADAKSLTFAGRILRRAGFAYDYKDMSTVRQLVVALLKANRKLAETIQTLQPAREQLDKLAHVVTLLEAYAGHEERQSPQYQEASKEIERLTAKIGRLEEKAGDLEAIEKLVAEKQAAIAGLDETIAKTNGEIEATAARLAEKTKEYEKKEQEIADLGKDHEQLRKDKAELLKKCEAHDCEVTDLNNVITDLRNKIEALKLERTEIERDFRQKISALENRMQMTENGMLAAKLEAELSALTQTSEKLRQQVIDEKLKREAFEERINIWVSREEELNQQVEKWRKRASIKLRYTVAATGTAGLGGLVISNMAGNVANGSPLGLYYGLCTFVPAVLAGAITKLDNRWSDAFKVFGVAGAIGAAVAGIGHIPMTVNNEGVRKQAQADITEEGKRIIMKSNAERQAFYRGIDGRVVQIVKDDKGNYSSIDLAEHYKAGQVTFDFSKGGNPLITHTLRLEEDKKAAPAAETKTADAGTATAQATTPVTPATATPAAEAVAPPPVPKP